MRLGNFQTLSLDDFGLGVHWTPPSRKPPLPLPARHEWGEGHLHRIGAANWNPLSLTLSPLLRRGERESTSRMVVVSRCSSAWDPRREPASGTAIYPAAFGSAALCA